MLQLAALADKCVEALSESEEAMMNWFCVSFEFEPCSKDLLFFFLKLIV